MQPVSKVHGQSFILPVRVYYEDTDAAGVVYYANYLRYLERARTEWLRAIGVEHQRLAAEQGIGFVVRSCTIEYLRPARLDDALEIVSRIASLGRAQLEFDQAVCRDGEQLVSARVRVACLDLRRMKPVGLPAEVKNNLIAYS